LARRRETPQDTRHELQLLIRELLFVNEVLIPLVEQLLLHRLHLTTGTQLGLTNTHLLLVLLHTQTAQLTRCSQLLLKALQS
jgi:vacuolar-type H+-ATPase subunit B/Vma2